tara:strand:- start:53 stop:385 length:333 start_codon:yes stop_codon:yes gene_type:complete
MLELRTEFENEKQPAEQKLWRAVLQRAFEDVIYPGIERSLVVFKYKAHLWFTSRQIDFDIVCNLAGYDGTYIQDAYLRMVDKEQIFFTIDQINYIKWRRNYNEKRNIIEF